MKQIEKDAIIMRQVMEKIMEVIVENDIIYSKDNMLRMAQILMAQSVSMVGMSSNNLKEFRDNTRKLVDNISSVMEQMDPQIRAKLIDQISKTADWFEDERNKLVPPEDKKKLN